MVWERVIYVCLAATFLVFTIRSVKSGKSVLIYRTTRRADDPLIFWAGVTITALVAAALGWLAFQPLPISEILRPKG